MKYYEALLIGWLLCVSASAQRKHPQMNEPWLKQKGNRYKEDDGKQRHGLNSRYATAYPVGIGVVVVRILVVVDIEQPKLYIPGHPPFVQPD